MHTCLATSGSMKIYSPTTLTLASLRSRVIHVISTLLCPDSSINRRGRIRFDKKIDCKVRRVRNEVLLLLCYLDKLVTKSRDTLVPDLERCKLSYFAPSSTSKEASIYYHNAESSNKSLH
jgi:hypothetical protein